MIYMIDNLQSFTDEYLSDIYINMPPERQEKVDRYKDILDKKLCILSYSLLCNGLKNEYGIIESVKFVYNKFGKPFLRDYPDIFFNFSHCRHGVICGISSTPIGVDIQEIGKFNVNVAQIVCSNTEYETILNSNSKEIAFCKLWTAKESVVKRLGTGICTDLKAVLTDNVKHTIKEGYVVSQSVEEII